MKLQRELHLEKLGKELEKEFDCQVYCLPFDVNKKSYVFECIGSLPAG